MPKPNAPGEWYSRDGRRIVVWKCGSTTWWRRVEDDEGISQAFLSLPGDDWLPAVAPTFPVLPTKPLMCLVRHECWEESEPPQWRCFRNGLKVGMRRYEYSEHKCGEYTVVPHPENDPAAVRMIEEARVAKA